MSDRARFSLASARRAAADGRVAAWVGEFLASRGSDNAVLAAGLAQREHAWFGPMRLPTADLVRLAGPEEGQVPCPIEPEEWEDDVEGMVEELEEGWEPPPLLVELRDGRLLVQDGNHRFEALTRAGEEEAWAIVWCDQPEEATRFARSVNESTRS